MLGSRAIPKTGIMAAIIVMNGPRSAGKILRAGKDAEDKRGNDGRKRERKHDYHGV